MIKILSPKIIGMRNYYGRAYAMDKLKIIDNYIIKKFTIWYNLKRQRPNRLEKMKEFRLLAYKEGLKTLSTPRMLKVEELLVGDMLIKIKKELEKSVENRL